jgi:hypothetical protein
MALIVVTAASTNCCSFTWVVGNQLRPWRRDLRVLGSFATVVRNPSNALRTISIAGSFGLLRCSMRASVRDSAGLNGRTMKSDMCGATATSGTIAMPRFDATALFNASTVPSGIGSRAGARPDSQPRTSA